ncbi:ComEC/Rec2 family competence protein [bacterium]|nr:ComEC/Rec2 family competence protein [bacterium]
MDWPYLALAAVALTVLCPCWTALVLCLALGGRKRLLLCLLVPWCLWRIQPAPPDPLSQVEGIRAQVVARICEAPVSTPKGCRFVAEVHHWTDRVDAFNGRWLVDWKGGQASEVALGELWHLQGVLVDFSPPAYPGDWDSGAYWGRRGVTQHLRISQARFLRPSPDHPLQAWRYRLTQRLADRLPGEGSALLCAIVYGDGSRLSGEVQDHFRRSGTSHLLVASGSNVAVFVGFVCWMGARAGWGPVRCAGLCLWLVPAYVVLAGAAPAMLRAGAMGWLALLARWSGHTVSLGRCLALGSLGVLLWDPNFIFDVGFQLSFAAVASLAWLTGPVADWLPPQMPLRNALAASLACTLGVMPCSMFVFHTLQPLSPLANLWMAPLVEGLLPVGLGLSALDLLEPRLGQLAVLPLKPWLWLILASARRWALWSPQIQVPDPGPMGWLAWLFFLTLVWMGPRLVTVAGAAGLALFSLIQPPASETLRVRWFWLGRSPAVWLSQGTNQAALLCSHDQDPLLERFRLAQGCAPFQCVLSLEDQPRRCFWAQGWMEVASDQLIYHHQGTARFGLVLNPSDWDGLSWGLDSKGGWVWGGGQPQELLRGQARQLWLQHRQLWIRAWNSF